MLNGLYIPFFQAFYTIKKSPTFFKFLDQDLTFILSQQKKSYYFSFAFKLYEAGEKADAKNYLEEYLAIKTQDVKVFTRQKKYLIFKITNKAIFSIIALRSY